MLERIILNSRYLALLTVVVTLFCAVVLYLYTSVTALLAVYQAITDKGFDLDSTKSMAVTFLKVVDFFFICIGLQIISAGIYKLFINPNISLPRVMESDSFSALKLTLVKIVSVVLLIDFVESAVDLGPSRELMEYGIAIAVMLVAVSWGAKSLMPGNTKA